MREALHAALRGLVASLCVLAYLFPYFYLPGLWWRAIPSTLLIFALGALTYGKEIPSLFGLRLSPRELFLSVGLFFIGLLAFRYLVLPVVTGETLTTILSDYFAGYIHQFVQVLNDEMILRAACLTLLLRVLPCPKAVVITTAVLFSVGHHIVYRVNGVLIGWPAMVSLFSFGAILNLLFVRFGHIGYGVALHYAWNCYRFNSVFLLDGHALGEGASFNYVEGNPWVVAGSLAFLAVCFRALSPPDASGSTGSGIALRDAAQHQDTGD